MYKYTPPKNSKADTAVLALFITAIACFAVASFSRMYAGLIQALGVIFIGAALFLFCRYTLSVYTYLIEDGNFVVLRTLGKKISPICSVSLKTGIAIVKMPHTAAEKEEYRKNCGNVHPKTPMLSSLISTDEKRSFYLSRMRNFYTVLRWFLPMSAGNISANYTEMMAKAWTHNEIC